MSALNVRTAFGRIATLALLAFCGLGATAQAATLTISGTGLTQQSGVSVCNFTSVTESGNGNLAVVCGSGSHTISITPVVNGTTCDSYTAISASGLGDWAVQGCASASPTITLDAPSQTGQTYPTGTAFTLKATATAPSGRTVSSVQFFADGILIHAGTLNGSQYEWAWNPSSGTYLVLARVTDSVGAVADTAPRQMTFQPAAPSMTIFYVHPDHLGTPRAVTRASDNQVVWRWDNSEPFGNSAPNENPSGLGTFTSNLRHPGQYFDAETGKHYNYYRDYDASIGRYIESDPIGLGGGFNSYGYADGQPLTAVDPFGLAAIVVCLPPVGCIPFPLPPPSGTNGGLGGGSGSNVIPFPGKGSKDDANSCPPGDGGESDCSKDQRRLERSKTYARYWLKVGKFGASSYRSAAENLNEQISTHNALCPRNRVERLDERPPLNQVK